MLCKTVESSGPERYVRTVRERAYCHMCLSQPPAQSWPWYIRSILLARACRMAKENAKSERSKNKEVLCCLPNQLVTL